MDEINHRLSTEERTDYFLEKDERIIGFLNDVVFWTKIVSVIGFVFLAIFLIVGITFIINPAPILTDNPILIPDFIGVMYLAFVFIGFFPFLYLFKFSNHLKKAISDNDRSHLFTAFYNLKAHYKYIGILLLLIAVIYGVAIILSLVAGVSIFMGR